MSCHGSHDETSNNGNTRSSGHGGGHMWLMLACCLLPLAAIAAISVLAIPGSAVLGGLAALLCPLMMFFMMFGMGHNRRSGAQEPPAER